MFSLSRKCTLCNKSVQFRCEKFQFSIANETPKSVLAAAYKPHEIEKNPLDTNYFHSKPQPQQKPFSLILPPPNITGTLHLGHALTASIQDVLVKWHKMQGIQTVWVPGLDHAGIATQVVVEKKLFKEKGLTRHDLGRQKFEEEIWKWKQEKSTTIIHQLKRLNIDLDWDKEVFTMDSKRSKAVTKAFIKLFNKGLIYRADHLVNWSCALQSAISDIEVDHLEIAGATDVTVPGYSRPIKFGILTKFAYRFEDSSELIVATTRPETILGDVAVAVNPKDSRYSGLIGKKLLHPFRNELIPVIGDEFVDPDFGTGAVKITPAHDPIDFNAAKRHNLKPLSIIDEMGLLNDNCGQFKHLKRFEARDVIINELAKKGLFKENQNHKMTIPICSRSKDIVESLIKPQWFLSCNQMAQEAVADVREGRLKIQPENFNKIWYQWLENVRDWCVSRQLWWGHRIPAYSCKYQQNHIWVAAETEQFAKIEASNLLNCAVNDVECIQDEDVLDTWFSSALQPFSVFNHKESKYYPLSLMETGHDILFFWVARMVMLGKKLTGQLPFDEVLLHGIICDVRGRKMSKSLGNVIAPEEVIDGSSLEQLKVGIEANFKNGVLSLNEFETASEGQQKMFPNGIPECGADALRFTLLSHNVKSHVINFDVRECHTNKLFGNKIWQATKFALLWFDKVAEAQSKEVFEEFDVEECALMDQWILSRLNFMIETLDGALKSYDFYIATGALKEFLYYEFCDIYLETIKSNLKHQTSSPISKRHCQTLLTCLDKSLRALAPFMPALSKHLHKHLPRFWGLGGEMSFPKATTRNEILEKEVDEVMEIVVGIRRLKKIFNLTYKFKPEVFLIPSNLDKAKKFSQVIQDLSHLYTFHILDQNASKPQKAGLIEDSIAENKIYLFVPEELRQNLELTKIAGKKEKLLKELEKIKAIAEPGDRHVKKMAQISEKITRLNYIETLSQ
ncbi:unnamed protein product [Ceutorhynchus assimilis]|uniref:valine--tRNA ligase n=1 Tax=Ceutorhynchus assimilis TaxID=467358 RepID=A0A9P0DJY4_9CUCU|nr:unnamed protein product [Ceutorhynchus assimilis]